MHIIDKYRAFVPNSRNNASSFSCPLSSSRNSEMGPPEIISKELTLNLSISITTSSSITLALTSGITRVKIEERRAKELRLGTFNTISRNKRILLKIRVWNPRTNSSDACCGNESKEVTRIILFFT